MGGMGLRTGCSSWTSDAWRGRFYPAGIADADRLRYYARRFDTVEVDASYYRDPGPDRARRWAAVTPEGFTFAMKMPKDLLRPQPPAPPEALGRLPPGPRYAVELREADWFRDPHLTELKRRLEELDIALVWSYLTFLDVPAERTADFVYLRFIGDHTTVPASVHGEIRIDRTDAVRRWAVPAREADRDGRDVFAYFNNHFAGFAPESVNLFRREMGLPPIPIAPPPWSTLADPGVDPDGRSSPG